MIRPLWLRLRAWLHWEPAPALPLPASFVDLLSQCRQYHVTSIQHAGTTITFQRGSIDPLEPPGAMIDTPQMTPRHLSPPAAAVNLDNCPCGHSIFEHSEGGCGHGCQPNECIGNLQATPEAPAT